MKLPSGMVRRGAALQLQGQGGQESELEDKEEAEEVEDE